MVVSEGDYEELRNEILKLVFNRTTTTPFYTPDAIQPHTIANNVPEFMVDALHPLVSVITRINPSPDWFLGVRNVDLCNRTSGKWMKEKKETRLTPYDAGTDSGDRFTSDNKATRPPGDISSISEEQLIRSWGLDPRKKMGLFQFSRKSERSSTGKTENDETFQCPNLASQTKWSCFMFIPVMLVLLHVFYLN